MIEGGMFCDVGSISEAGRERLTNRIRNCQLVVPVQTGLADPKQDTHTRSVVGRQSSSEDWGEVCGRWIEEM